MVGVAIVFLSDCPYRVLDYSKLSLFQDQLRSALRYRCLGNRNSHVSLPSSFLFPFILAFQKSSTIDVVIANIFIQGTSVIMVVAGAFLKSHIDIVHRIILSHFFSMLSVCRFDKRFPSLETKCNSHRLRNFSHDLDYRYPLLSHCVGLQLSRLDCLAFVANTSTV